MGVVAQPFSDIMEEVRCCEMEVLWMEVRTLEIYHPDHQDNLVLHYHDYHESHLVTRFQKKGLEALSHYQAFHLFYVIPHALPLSITSVLKLGQKVCLVKTPFISMDQCDLLPCSCGIWLVLDLKEHGLVDGPINDLGNRCLHLIIGILCIFMLLDFLISKQS